MYRITVDHNERKPEPGTVCFNNMLYNVHVVRPGVVLHVKESNHSQCLKIIKLSVPVFVPLTS